MRCYSVRIIHGNAFNQSIRISCPSTCPRQESTLEKPSLRARFELQSAHVLDDERRE